jgi:hypothetical protein
MAALLEAYACDPYDDGCSYLVPIVLTVYAFDPIMKRFYSIFSVNENGRNRCVDGDSEAASM